MIDFEYFLFRFYSAVFLERGFIKKVLYSVLFILFFIYVLSPHRFAASYPFIREGDIVSELEPLPVIATTSDLLPCPLIPSDLSNDFLYPNVSVDESSLEELAVNLNVKTGGFWEPENCVSRYLVAIVIPYRNRSSQLQIFLSHMHPFLQKQKIAYRFFVVEQNYKHAFNRAKLFNIGYKEAMKIQPYHCFIFHDVDLIPQKLSNIYACTRQPRHMSSSVNTFRYNLPYRELFGGAVAILQKQFDFVNGFSNLFFGWGGEDDDFHGRVVNKGMTICRFDPTVARYYMLTHPKEPPSEARFVNLKSGAQRFNSDGLNTLSYKVLNIDFRSLFTRILVEV